jgi:hypothetical protein
MVCRRKQLSAAGTRRQGAIQLPASDDPRTLGLARHTLRQHESSGLSKGDLVKRTRRLTIILIFGFAHLSVAALIARGDCITLKSGGELRGTVLTDAKSFEKATEIALRTMSGATVMVARDEIATVVRRRLLVEEYETERRAASDTVAGQWDLAEWCRRKSLVGERARHLQRVLELDEEHVAAHRALGHVRLGTGWGTPADLKAEKGFVKHNGKFLARGEVADKLVQERANDAQRKWSKQVRQWHTWMTGSHSELRAHAEREFTDLRDPDAVPALARVLHGDDNEERRLFFVKVLSQIDGDRPIPALATQSLRDESESVRAAALSCIQQKEIKQAVPVFVRALKDPANVIVNRAGAALGALGEASAISPLIDALVTRHEYAVEIPNPEPFICTEGQNNTGNVVLPPSVALKLISSGMMPLVARSMPKPVPGQEPEKEMILVTYQQDEENPEVLGALVSLTEQDCGFDKQTWRRWFNKHKRNAGPAKLSKASQP